MSKVTKASRLAKVRSAKAFVKAYEKIHGPIAPNSPILNLIRRKGH